MAVVGARGSGSVVAAELEARASGTPVHSPGRSDGLHQLESG